VTPGIDYNRNHAAKRRIFWKTMSESDLFDVPSRQLRNAHVLGLGKCSLHSG